MNYVEAQINRSFFCRPRGGYPQPHPGAINIGNAPIVIRFKGSRSYQPVRQTAQAQA